MLHRLRETQTTTGKIYRSLEISQREIGSTETRAHRLFAQVEIRLRNYTKPHGNCATERKPKPSRQKCEIAWVKLLMMQKRVLKASIINSLSKRDVN